MTDGITAMYDAMDHYEWLCERYKEKPQYTHTREGERMLACYGQHAQALEKRLRNER
jgi:hypothetical protein